MERNTARKTWGAKLKHFNKMPFILYLISKLGEVRWYYDMDCSQEAA
jgi:hypothetical protein